MNTEPCLITSIRAMTMRRVITKIHISIQIFHKSYKVADYQKPSWYLLQEKGK